MSKKMILKTLPVFLLVCFSACSGIPRSVQEVGYYSFPITANNYLEINRITSVINEDKYMGNSFADNRIMLSGKIMRTNFMVGWFPFRSYELEVSKTSDADSTHLWLPPYEYTYRWTGQILTEKYVKDFFVDFEAYGFEDGSQKYFVLQAALLDEVKLDFPNPFEIPDIIGEFPYQIGYIELPDQHYRVLSVYNHTANVYERDKGIFYHPSQLFQILDEDDTVVAELEKDEYSIFDTLPEQNRESIKKGIALMFAFRHATLVLKNSRNGWIVPTTKDMVYP